MGGSGGANPRSEAAGSGPSWLEIVIVIIVGHISSREELSVRVWGECCVKFSEHISQYDGGSMGYHWSAGFQWEEMAGWDSIGGDDMPDLF